MSDAVVIQAIATAGAVIVVGLPLWFRVRHGVAAAQDAAASSATAVSALGTPNGKGDIVTMLEASLQNQRALMNLAEEHEKLDVARFDAIDKRLETLERGTQVVR